MLGFVTVLPPAERAVADVLAGASGAAEAPPGAAGPDTGLENGFYRTLLALLGGSGSRTGEDGAPEGFVRAGAETQVLPLPGNSLPEDGVLPPAEARHTASNVAPDNPDAVAASALAGTGAELLNALPPGAAAARGGALDDASRVRAAALSTPESALRPAVESQWTAAQRLAADGQAAPAAQAVGAREPAGTAPLDPIMSAADRTAAAEPHAERVQVDLLKPLLRAVESASGGTVQSVLPLGAVQQAAAPVTDPGRVSLPIHAPFDQSDWGEEVGQRIRWLTAQHIQVAELRINPPQLGPVEVRVTVHHDQTSLLFTAHHALIREALEESVPRLREIMAGSGVTLADVDVREHSSSGRQGYAAQGEDGRDARYDRGAQASAALEIDQLSRVARGVVDLYA